MNWDNINVWQFQQINNLITKKNIKYDENATIDALAVLFNLNRKQVLDLNDKQLKKGIKDLEFLFITNPEFKHLNGIKIDNNIYDVEYDVENSKAGRYIEIKYFSSDILNNAQKIMASMINKRKNKYVFFNIKNKEFNHQELADKIHTLPFSGIYGSISKKIELIKELESNFKGLFDQSNFDIDDKPHPFMKSFGWIYQAKLVAEHEGIKLNEVFEMTTLNFLNDLSYIASKSKYEEEMRKKINGKH